VRGLPSPGESGVYVSVGCHSADGSSRVWPMGDSIQSCCVVSICSSVLAQNYCTMAACDFRTVQWMVYDNIFPAMCAVYYKRLEQTDLHSWCSCWLQWFHLGV